MLGTTDPSAWWAADEANRRRYWAYHVPAPRRRADHIDQDGNRRSSRLHRSDLLDLRFTFPESELTAGLNERGGIGRLLKFDDPAVPPCRDSRLLEERCRCCGMCNEFAV